MQLRADVCIMSLLMFLTSRPPKTWEVKYTNKYAEHLPHWRTWRSTEKRGSSCSFVFLSSPQESAAAHQMTNTTAKKTFQSLTSTNVKMQFNLYNIFEKVLKKK